MKKYLIIISIILGLGGIATTGFVLDDRFAKSTFVMQIDERLDIKIINDKIWDKKKEIREERSWLREHPNDAKSIRNLDKLEDELEELEKEREGIYGKT